MTNTRSSLALVFATLSGLCAACRPAQGADQPGSANAKAQGPRVDGNAQEEWRQALDHARNAFDKTRHDAVVEIERALTTLRPQLEQLKLQLHEVVGDARTKLNALVSELESEQGALHIKLGELREKGNSAWDRVLAETRDAAAALAARCESALAERQRAKSQTNTPPPGP